MSLKYLLIAAVAVCSSATGFANQTPDAMRAAQAVQINTKYSSTIAMTKDANGNIVSFHVNGVGPSDAGILLTKEAAPLSTEYTVVSGINKEGGISAYMLPTNIATAHVVESISRDLVNAGALNIQISKQFSGRPQ